MVWTVVLFAMAGVVAVVGEPRPVALVVAGIAAATATFDAADHARRG